MLVSSESPGYAEVNWTGVETIFSPAGLICEDKAHVTVKYRDAADAVSTLTDGVHLTLTRNATTGAVTAEPVAMPAAPGEVIFERDTPAVQGTNFQNLVGYDAALHEKLHSRGMMIAGELRRDQATILAAAEDIPATLQQAQSHATTAGQHKDAAAASAAAAANSAAALMGTSLTSRTIGIANGVGFVTQAGKQFNAGQYVLIVDAANPLTKQMHGVIASYAGTALSVDVSYAVGSGTIADWIIFVSSPRGPIGEQGPAAIAKRVVRFRTTANVNLAGGGLAAGTSHDGVSAVAGDLAFVAAQSAPAEIGIYVVPASGAASRHGDYNTWIEIVEAGLIGVQEGSAYPDTLWQFTANDGGTLDTTAVTFKQIDTLASETVAGKVEHATVGEIRSSAAGNLAVTAEKIESASAPVALTDAATVAVDWDTFINASLTVTANRAIGNPTNGQPGTWRTIMVQGNDATDRTITFGNQFLGDVPVIADCDNGRWYLLTIFCVTATHFVVSAKKANGS